MRRAQLLLEAGEDTVYMYVSSYVSPSDHKRGERRRPRVGLVRSESPGARYCVGSGSDPYYYCTVPPWLFLVHGGYSG